MQAPAVGPKAGSTTSTSDETMSPDIVPGSVPDALAALPVTPEQGLTQAEVEDRRKAHGYNEVAERKTHPGLMFLGKFWGVSAWMLELIMVLSAVLFVYAMFACLVVNDTLKVAIIKWRVPAAAVAS